MKNDIDLNPLIAQLGKIKGLNFHINQLDHSIRVLQLKTKNELEPLLKTVQLGRNGILQEQEKTIKANENLILK